MPTIGVSIPVPPPWGDAIQLRRMDYGNDEAVGIPTHITVLGPTEVREDAMDEVRDHLGTAMARVPGFTVSLRGTGTFRPLSPVVYVRVARGVESCELLEREVRRGPLGRELAFPYHPHVTVVHGAEEEVLDRAFAEMAGFTADFPVDAVCLYVQQDGRWRDIDAFPLAPAQAAAERSTLE